MDKRFSIQKERKREGQSIIRFIREKFLRKRNLIIGMLLSLMFQLKKESGKAKKVRELYKVEIINEKNGEKRYVHSDKETTYYIEFVTGKEIHREFLKKIMALEYIKIEEIRNEKTLTEKEIDLYARRYFLIEKEANEEKIKKIEEIFQKIKSEKNILTIIKTIKNEFPEIEFEEKETKDIIQKLKELQIELKERRKNYKNFDTFFENYFLSFQELFRSLDNKKNKIIYESIWELEIKNGSPRIRSSIEYQYDPINPYRAYYDISNNTIYLSENLIISDEYFAELAHAQQFASGSIIKNAFNRINKKIDYLVTKMKVKFDKSSKNLEEKYYYHQLDEYENPFSVENRAHKEIEKNLKKEFTEKQQKKKIKVILQ